jgi:Na+/H+-dicarboxylate symporter
VKGGRSAGSGSLTIASLCGLAAGLTAGIAAHQTNSSLLLGAVPIFEPIGTLWTNALRMIVVPLIVSNLIVAVVSTDDPRKTGRLGGISLLTFLALMVAGTIFTYLTAPALIARYPIDRAAIESLQPETPVAALDGSAAGASTTDWIVSLVPANIFQAAAKGEILPLVVCTLLFAMAILRVAPERRQALAGVFQGVADASMVIVRWILWLIPLGAFALAFTMTARTGVAVAAMLGFFIVLVSGLMIVFTGGLYPLTALFGRVPLRRFARSVAPSQAVAAATRSSLAALPPMIEGAEVRMGLPGQIGSFVLPLAVSTFKFNRAISSNAKMLFLAAVYGVHLDPLFLGTFAVASMVLSVSSPGLPSHGASLSTLPFYLDVGIPIEAVVLLNAVDAIPDIFKTVLNVTGNMSAAAIVGRFAGAPAAVHFAGPVAGPMGTPAGREAIGLRAAAVRTDI